MTKPFYADPILNSPYFKPTRHHALDANGKPQDVPPVAGRRRSEYITPVPPARRKRQREAQEELGFDTADEAGQKYNPSPIINELREHLESWRNLRNPND